MATQKTERMLDDARGWQWGVGELDAGIVIPATFAAALTRTVLAAPFDPPIVTDQWVLFRRRPGAKQWAPVADATRSLDPLPTTRGVGSYT